MSYCFITLIMNYRNGVCNKRDIILYRKAVPVLQKWCLHDVFICW